MLSKHLLLRLVSHLSLIALAIEALQTMITPGRADRLSNVLCFSRLTLSNAGVGDIIYIYKSSLSCCICLMLSALKEARSY